MDIAELIGSAFADGQVLTVPWGIDYFSVVVGVLTGALFACDRKLDIIGTVVLGLVTGYGGGIIRDVLLQDKGVYFTSHPDLILVCIVLCAFVFYFRGLFKHLDAMVFFADALSVGLFALAGASKAYACGEGFVLTVILGAITAVGGGAVRDICVGETPGIFQQSNFYAVAGLGGALLFTVLAYAGVPLVVAGIACVFTVGFLRYWSVYFDWKTRNEADLTPHVARGLGKVRRVVAGVFLQGGDRISVRRQRKRLRAQKRAGHDGGCRAACEGERPEDAGCRDDGGRDAGCRDGAGGDANRRDGADEDANRRDGASGDANPGKVASGGAGRQESGRAAR